MVYSEKLSDIFVYEKNEAYTIKKADIVFELA